MVLTIWVDAMFVSDDFPELGANLVTTLASLNMNDFSHLYGVFVVLIIFLVRFSFNLKKY